MGYAAVPLYLCSCWLYEKKSVTVISDPEFDQLCVHLKKHWDEIKHPHKQYIDFEALDSATASYIDWSTIPAIVIGGAKAMYKEATGQEL